MLLPTKISSKKSSPFLKTYSSEIKIIFKPLKEIKKKIPIKKTPSLKYK
jgi:hypothetical protein